MGYDASRRCAVWVSPSVLAAAQELADLVGADVDTFVAVVILELHDRESEEGRLRARPAGTEVPSSARVIPMPANRGKRIRQAQASHE